MEWVAADRLHDIIEASVHPLERELARNSFTGGFGEDLQLRYSSCGIATAALQRYLQERYDLQTDRMIATPPKAPREVNSRRMAHVVLHHEGYIIDPTYSQFLTYVGLHPTRVLNNEDLRSYYPQSKIALIDTINAKPFTDGLAKHAHEIVSDVQRLAIDRFPPHAPDDSLVKATLAEIKEVYADIWTYGHYEPFPLDIQSDDMRNAAIRIADNMLN